MKQRIAEALQERFHDNDMALEHFGGLLEEYAESGLSPPHLISEIETGSEGKLLSNIWEAMLYRHLHSKGYELHGTVKKAGQHGPDFCIHLQDKKIWIEAVVPSPEGIPSDWLEPIRHGEIRARKKPDKQRVLRCTSAIKDKQKKFEN